MNNNKAHVWTHEEIKVYLQERVDNGVDENDIETLEEILKQLKEEKAKE